MPAWPPPLPTACPNFINDCAPMPTPPAGFGTLDETLEVTTWQQLGFHAKPVGLLNVNGFFDKLLTFLDHAAAEVSCGRGGGDGGGGGGARLAGGGLPCLPTVEAAAWLLLAPAGCGRLPGRCC